MALPPFQNGKINALKQALKRPERAASPAIKDTTLYQNISLYTYSIYNFHGNQ
jgi:hypothetical protein